MIDIDWGAFGLVLVAALAASVVIVVFYSVALRLLALGPDGQHRPVPATVGAVVCIAVCVAAVLYGVYLVIPLFHGK
jgi:hypothetical protein